MDQAVDDAVQSIAAGVEGCASPEAAISFLWETRTRLVPRLEVMRRRKREPGMATYVARVVACIDDALAAGMIDTSTDPNDPIRRVVEEEEMVTPRGEDADHIEDAEPIVEPAPGAAGGRDQGLTMGEVIARDPVAEAAIEHEGRTYRVTYHFEPFLDQGFAGIFTEMEQADEPERRAALHREALRRLVVAWDVEDAAGRIVPLAEVEVRAAIPDPLAAVLARGVLDDAKRRAARMKATRWRQR